MSCLKSMNTNQMSKFINQLPTDIGNIIKSDIKGLHKHLENDKKKKKKKVRQPKYTSRVIFDNKNDIIDIYKFYTQNRNKVIKIRTDCRNKHILFQFRITKFEKVLDMIEQISGTENHYWEMEHPFFEGFTKVRENVYDIHFGS